MIYSSLDSTKTTKYLPLLFGSVIPNSKYLDVFLEILLSISQGYNPNSLKCLKLSRLFIEGIGNKYFEVALVTYDRKTASSLHKKKIVKKRNSATSRNQICISIYFQYTHLLAFPASPSLCKNYYQL